MADAPYLIAIALLEQDGCRAMPLQGKSLRAAIASDADPNDVGRQQALELLLRVWQRSDDGAVQRAGGDESLLLAEVPIEALQQDLPQLKADWLNSGDTAGFVAQLRQLASGIWCLRHEPRTPLVFKRLQ